MNDKVRCPSCRGSKKVAKIGGIVGDCSKCDGTGKINASDKPVIVVPDVVANVVEISKAVADCVPVSDVCVQDLKVSTKNVLYRKKRG